MRPEGAFMVIRIRTLVEDTVEKPDLVGEHGLSLLISTLDKIGDRLLFHQFPGCNRKRRFVMQLGKS
jgi:hypothetical protein